MHGAGHWVAFRVLLGGGTVLRAVGGARTSTPTTCGRRSSGSGPTSCSSSATPSPARCSTSWSGADYDLSSLNVVLSGGAALSRRPQGGAARPPADGDDRRRDGFVRGRRASWPTCRPPSGASTGSFPPRPGTHVLSAELDRELAPGDDEVGWLAKSGRLALGYLGDAEKTARTYPIVDGVRYAVPGDRARLLADGSIELHGRDAVTINSGGEKIFAEEVEAAVKAHPAVYDCVVTGRPSERWGNEVVAVVALRARRRRRPTTSCAPRPGTTSPATSCRRRPCSSTRSSARPPARPTTAGPARWPSPPATRPADPALAARGSLAWRRDRTQPAGTATRCPRATRSGRRCATCSTPIAPRYDLVNRIMTFRLDVRWRKRAVRALGAARRAPPSLDLASGTGDLCIDLARGRAAADLGRPQLRDAAGRPQRGAAGAGRRAAAAVRRRRRSTA